MKLIAYNFVIKYKPGKNNLINTPFKRFNYEKIKKAFE